MPLLAFFWCPARWNRLFAACTLLLPVVGHAERLFVGILEVDSFQSVNYGVAAFSRVSDLPLAQEQVQVWLSKTLLLPSFDGISATEPLRIVQSVDPAAPLSEDNPANVALIPLVDKGTAPQRAFVTAYSKQTSQGAFTLFEAPADTNLPPRVALAFSGHHMLASPSLPALDWAWENRAKLINAPAQSLPGTFRVLVNPQRLADLIGTHSAKAVSFLDVDGLLRAFESLSFSITLEGAALGFTLRGTPQANSPLDALVTSWRTPAETLWDGIPDTAFFVSIGTFDKPNLWDAFLGTGHTRLLRPISGHAPQTAFAGERLLYAAPTRNGQGLCFVQLESVKDTARVQEALRSLSHADEKSDVTFTDRGHRQAAGTTIATYAINLRAPEAGPNGKPGEPSVMHTLLALLLKRAVLETAVANGYLVTVIGPAGTIEDQLPPPSFTAQTLTLNRRISGQDPALDAHLMFGGSLHLANLLRHTVSIMPDVKPEQARRLPQGGDGARFGVSLSGHTVTASLRFQANEIAALQRMNRDGRAVLQEVFFQIFAKQMMELEASPTPTPAVP